jgi:branched-chain amino acid aminotransferase
MPAYIRLLTPVGLQPAPYDAESLADAVKHEPVDGIYTVTNTFNQTRVLKIDAHLDRMEDSARRAGIDLTLDRPRLRAALRQMILAAGFGDVRFRVTVGKADPNTFILTLEPFHPLPATLITQGVKVITAPNSGRQNPAAKTTDWMHERTRLQNAMPPGIYDTILLDQRGTLLEGLGANFYAIMDGRLYTAGEGVLPGIAQQIVFAVAPDIMPVHREALTLSDLALIDEAFITSSSRGVVPVVEIDRQTIGDGQPGAFTLRLRAAYLDWLEKHLEEL